jgi:hypothetical protein
LGYLPSPVSARKLRLAYCACLRGEGVWPVVVSKSSRRAVEFAERYAEGRVSSEELRTVRTSAHGAWARIGPLKPPQYAAAELAHNACWLDPMLRREGLATLRRIAREGRLVIPAAPFREIFGNPFRPVTVDPAWQTPALTPLAQAAYEERILPGGELDAQRLAILADALEEAGCTDPALLGHLRSPGPHVRGCWAVDLVLAKV